MAFCKDVGIDANATDRKMGCFFKKRSVGSLMKPMDVFLVFFGRSPHCQPAMAFCQDNIE